MYVVIRKLKGMRSIDEAGGEAAEGVGAIMSRPPVSRLLRFRRRNWRGWLTDPVRQP